MFREEVCEWSYNLGRFRATYLRNLDGYQCIVIICNDIVTLPYRYRMFNSPYHINPVMTQLSNVVIELRRITVGTISALSQTQLRRNLITLYIILLASIVQSDVCVHQVNE
jgi:hypothetical protein